MNRGPMVSLSVRVSIIGEWEKLFSEACLRTSRVKETGGVDMKKIERAVAWFEEGFSCTQAILSTYGSDFGLDRDIALRVAGGFGGGMGRMGKTCGAVTGAFMVLGLKYGSADATDNDKKEKTYALVREFANQFSLRNGHIGCNELLGHDISTPDGRKEAQEKGLFSTLCPKLVRDAAEIVEQLL